MAIEWKVVKDGYSEIGVDWNVTATNTSVTYAPIVYLYYYVNSSDSYIEYTWNLKANGSSVTNGSMTLSTNGAFSGSKQIDSFASRSISKDTSSKTLTLALDFADLFYGYGSGQTSTFSGTWTYTVPALTSYTISYNANGGSGAPSSQKKYYGKTLTLSTTTPKRTGYTFAGWATSSTSTTVAYKAGGSYTANAAATLYAVWVAGEPFVITYNANGGSGAPSSQNKTAGVAITLSTTVPTRANYRFAGWSTNSTATFAPYKAGSTFTTDADVTLYAVWHTSIYDSYDLLIPTSSDMQDLWFEIGNNTEISDLYYRIS